ncbi:hypothetical protein K8352_08425 [Flavobacteriaceae bacterium F89]|uniref:Chloroplast import component protein (Tic20) n=1 Tax=Cerina litoralis TaxID=2874477 RepID=A0AAE3JP93_9FLAO|nr:hypothetical protein [Cerina litoralis]MCG2460771.1 hypothetical protein [Cerina litoralis]
MENIEKGKNTALIAYMTIIGSIIAMSMNRVPKNEFARFHTRQAFGIHLAFHAFAILLTVAFNKYAWYGLYVFYLVLWGYGFIGALNYKKQLIPVLGAYFQKWFTFID